MCILHALLPSLLTLSLSHLFDMYSTLTSMQATSGSIHQLSYRLYTYTFTSPLFLLFFFMVRVYLDWMNMCVCVCVFVCVYARVSVCLWVFFSGAGKLKSAFAGIDIGNQLTPSSALIPKTQKKTKKLLDRSSSRILNQETLKSWHRQKRWINFSIPTDGRLTVNFSAISER